MLFTVISAVSATLIHDAISNPTEVIKQRMQMYGSPYKSVLQCTRGVYQAEGLRAFYRSYATQLVMNLPYQAIHFTTYEFFQNMVCVFFFFITIYFYFVNKFMKNMVDDRLLIYSNVPYIIIVYTVYPYRYFLIYLLHSYIKT